MVVCPDCNGLGHRGHYAFDIIKREAVKVNELTWDTLPFNEDIAEYRGMRYCKLDLEVCPTCKGSGEVFK